MRIRIEAQLEVGVRWDERARVFVSYAPAIGIYSQGPTRDEAVRAMESAARLYFVTAHAANKLEGMLQGFAVSSGFGPDSPSAHQSVKIVNILKDSGFDSIESKSIPLELTQV